MISKRELYQLRKICDSIRRTNKIKDSKRRTKDVTYRMDPSYDPKTPKRIDFDEGDIVTSDRIDGGKRHYKVLKIDDRGEFAWLRLEETKDFKFHDDPTSFRPHQIRIDGGIQKVR